MVQKGHLVLNGQEEALNVEKDLVLKKGYNNLCEKGYVAALPTTFG